MTSEFTEIKTMMSDALARGKGRWYDNINNYRNEIGLTWEQLKELDKNSLKKTVREYDNDQWRRGLEGKHTLRFYNTEKKSIGYDFCYRNSYSSKIYARARSNALLLEEQRSKINKDHDTTCKLCGEEKEDIVHFTIN